MNPTEHFKTLARYNAWATQRLGVCFSNQFMAP
jgi:uncharacterized damage-inducible protein DinB